MPARGKARVPTEIELRRLFSVTRAAAHAQRDAAVLAMSYRLGLRAMEIASLRVKDVLDERGRLVEECALTSTMTKAGRARIAYLTNPSVRGPLKAYLDERRQCDDILFNIESALFRSQKGGGFSPNTMQQLLHRLHERA